LFRLSAATPNVFYRVVSVAQPSLALQSPVGGYAKLLLSGTPWSAYEIEYTTDLGAPSTWQVLTRVALTNSSQLVTGLSVNIPNVFYRAVSLNADPPILEAHLDHQNRSLLVFGLRGTSYSLQTSSNLSASIAWLPMLNYTLTNDLKL